MRSDAEVTLWRRGAAALLAALLFVVVPSPAVARATDIFGTCAGALHDVATYDYDALVSTAAGGGTDEAGVGLSSGGDGCGAMAASSDAGDIYDASRSSAAPRGLVNETAGASALGLVEVLADPRVEFETGAFPHGGVQQVTEWRSGGRLAPSGIPRGFGNAADFGAFVDDLYSGLRGAGL